MKEWSELMCQQVKGRQKKEGEKSVGQEEGGKTRAQKGEILGALVEMSLAYCGVEINSFITLCSHHYRGISAAD